MSGKVTYWTEGKMEELRKEYLSLSEEFGLYRIRWRIGTLMGKSPATIDNALRRLPDWDAIRVQGRLLNEERIAKNRAKRAVHEVATPTVEPDDPTLRKLEQRVLSLRDENMGLRKKLKVSDRQQGIISELITVAKNQIEPIIPNTIRSLHVSKFKAIKKDDEREKVDAVVMLSDEHGDRIIDDAGTWGMEHYNFNIFRCRLWEWAKMIKRYTVNHLPNYEFETLWVWKLGDAVQGDIHDQKLRNHYGNTLKAALAIGDVEAQALAYLAPYFKRIVVVCIPGNHGRTTKQLEWEGPHDNFDYLVAKTIEMRVAAHENVQVFTPNAWSAHVEVRGWLWHLNHGMGVTGSMGIPWYGFEKREGRVQRLVSFKDRQVDYFAYGHFHTPMTRPAGRGKAIHAGAWFFTDAFSLNKLNVGNMPEQQLLVFSERFGRQMEIPLMVRDEKREKEFRLGKYDPPFGKNLILDSDEDHLGVREMPVIK